MNAREVFAVLTGHGVQLRAEGSLLLYRPADIADDFRALIVVYKPGLLDLLMAPPPAPLPWTCPRCGPVDATRWRARGCGGCRLHAEAPHAE